MVSTWQIQTVADWKYLKKNQFCLYIQMYKTFILQLPSQLGYSQHASMVLGLDIM